MKRVKVKAPSKINLTLDVSPLYNGYHPICSLVSMIDVCDEIELVKRTDRKITLTEKGLSTGCDITENNAFKATKAFIEKFDTCGVDIFLNKKIPIAGGLGGSSADIAGVLNGLKKLFKIEDSVTDISDALASDATYMLKGGYAVISDRGNTVRYLDINKTLYLNLITNRKQITARDCYKAFDGIGKLEEGVTEKAVDALFSGDDNKFFSLLSNGLYNASLTFIPELASEIEDLEKTGAKASLMTGSGSVVYGVYLTEKERNTAYQTLYEKYGNRIIKCKTI